MQRTTLNAGGFAILRGLKQRTDPDQKIDISFVLPCLFPTSSSFVVGFVLTWRISIEGAQRSAGFVDREGEKHTPRPLLGQWRRPVAQQINRFGRVKTDSSSETLMPVGTAVCNRMDPQNRFCLDIDFSV